MVPRISTGAAPGSPSSSAGSWISPPPPTTASTNPAARPASASSASTERRVLHSVSATGAVDRAWATIVGRRVRIVSLLPSTTEILFAVGAGDDVVGVTFECDHPAEARDPDASSRRRAMPEGLTPAEIDAFVVAAMRRGEDLYHLDEGALAGLDADLVVTQDLCAVCAVDVSVVDDALAHLGCTAEVLTIDPHTLEEVFESILTLGRATGHDAEAAALVGRPARPADAVRARVAGLPPPAGDAAGVDRPAVRARPLGAGDDRGGRRGAVLGTGRREVRRGSRGTPCTRREPEVVVVAPCGYDRAGAARRWRTSWSPPACCRTACPCTPWTPTPRGPGPAPGWSTASRSWRRCCTPDVTRFRDGCSRNLLNQRVVWTLSV